MSRAHIGSYLGLRLETVSRALSAFSAAGWITVERNGVTLRDVPALRRVAGEQDGPGSQARRARPLTPLNEGARRGRIVGIAQCAPEYERGIQPTRSDMTDEKKVAEEQQLCRWLLLCLDRAPAFR